MQDKEARRQKEVTRRGPTTRKGPATEMAGRGRTAGFQMGAEHRTKIANSKVLKRLIAFAEGDENVDMKPHQVTAALGLLDRIMPKLANVEMDLGTDGIHIHLHRDAKKV